MLVGYADIVTTTVVGVVTCKCEFYYVNVMNNNECKVVE